MSDENETTSQPVTGGELDQLFRNTEIDFESNRRRRAKDNDRYARLIASRQIESYLELRDGAFVRLLAANSRSVAPASSVTPKPGTKAEFAHRLQVNIKAMGQNSFRVKLGAAIGHGETVFGELLADDQRDMTQQHERLAERVELLTKQCASLAWYCRWRRLGIVGELTDRSGAASGQGRTGGLARFQVVSAELQRRAVHLLEYFEPYRSMRAEQASRVERED